MNEPSRRAWCFSVEWRWLVWLACVLGSTAALVGPSLSLMLRQQIDAGENPELDQQFFLASKLFHVADYALLAVLTGLLPASRGLRALLLVGLSMHAVGTEFIQQFIETRTGNWRDVGLDHLGIALGIALTWKWWRRPSELFPFSGEPETTSPARSPLAPR